MKALTIWQPWASLIVAGAKPYEFRGRRAPRSIIGQRIVIHAAKRAVDRSEIDWLVRMIEAGGQWAARTCLHPHLALPVLRQAHALPLSAGIGSAIVGDPKIGTECAAEFGVPRGNDSDRDEHANWGWPMLAIEAWDQPIPMRGAQGFWPWATPEMVP